MAAVSPTCRRTRGWWRGCPGRRGWCARSPPTAPWPRACRGARPRRCPAWAPSGWGGPACCAPRAPTPATPAPPPPPAQTPGCPGPATAARPPAANQRGARGHVTSAPPTTAHLGVEGGQEAPHHGVDVAHVPPRHPGQLLRGAEVQLRPAAGQLAQLPAQLPVSRPQLVVEPHHPAGPVQLLHQLQVGADARGVALVGVELLARAGVVAEGHHLAVDTLLLSPPAPCAAPCPPAGPRPCCGPPCCRWWSPG